MIIILFPAVIQNSLFLIIFSELKHKGISYTHLLKPLHFPDFKSQSPAYLKSRAKRKIIAGNILLHT